MVAHLQHIHLEVGPAVDEVPFGVGFHITCEQKAGGTVINAEDNGGIVGVTVLRHRAQLGDGCPGHLYLSALLLGVLDKILKTLGAGLRHRGIDVVGREVSQCRGQTAHMVLVGVGAEDVFQPLHALSL